MSWRPAKCLVQLKREVDVLYPNRGRGSDGFVGDLAHARRESDHNPNAQGVVRAVDLTIEGADGRSLFAALYLLARAGTDRLAGGGYVIHAGLIVSERSGWQPRPYAGPNPHTHHVHVSCTRDPQGYDNAARWWPLEEEEAMTAEQWKLVETWVYFTHVKLDLVVERLDQLVVLAREASHFTRQAAGSVAPQRVSEEGGG